MLRACRRCPRIVYTGWCKHIAPNLVSIQCLPHFLEIRPWNLARVFHESLPSRWRFFFFFFGRYDFSISVFVVKFGIFGSWDMSTILLSFCMESSLGVKYNLILALRSQIFECWRERFYTHALEYLQSARWEKNEDKNTCYGNAWPLYLVEGLRSVGASFRP